MAEPIIMTVKINEPFPLACPKAGEAILLINGGGLSEVISLEDINDEQINTFCNEPCKLMIYTEEYIPLLLFKTKTCKYPIATLNIWEIDEKRQKLFLNSPPEELFFIFLVETKTSLLRGVKLLRCPKDFIMKFKNTLIYQLNVYNSREEMMQKAETIKKVVQEKISDFKGQTLH
jgi:hypothetical protein